MDTSREELKHTSGKKTRTSGTIKHDKLGITKKEFYAVLDKASQPIKREGQSDSEQS